MSRTLTRRHMGHDDILEAHPVEVTLNYVLVSAAPILALYLLFRWLWGNSMLTTVTQLLAPGYNSQGLASVWFIFVWGTVGTLLLTKLFGRDDYSYESRGVRVLRGWWVSLNAGVFEEFVYRAWLFLIVMPVLQFVNFITFGLVEWVYSWWLPVVNWATFGALEPQLLHSGWLLGAAISMAASMFSDAHKYLGWIGYINSWFLGMIMFFLVFNYGLLTAIVAHVLYDVVVLTTRTLLSD